MLPPPTQWGGGVGHAFLVARWVRAASGPLVLEAGGMGLRIHEADLGLRTVRCWIGALTARMEPRLLIAAADVRVLKEWRGRDRRADELLPMRILWSAGEEPSFAPRGHLKVEEGAEALACSLENPETCEACQ